LPIPSYLYPDEDQRLWIDGSFKDGFIGYSIITRPGYKRLYGGDVGTCASEAEWLAARKALDPIHHSASCANYRDYLPVIVWLSTLGYSERYARQIRVQYMNDNDPRHREAHDLANRGRREVEKQQKALKPKMIDR
jgi:hypothetical protein